MKNIGDKIFAYTKLELERSVDQLFASTPSLREKRPPILAEAVLDKFPDVKRLEAMPMLASNFGVEAMVLAPRFMHRHLTVVVDHEIMNHRNSARYNMAIAEELGHIQLNRAVMLEIQDYHDFTALQEHPRWEIAERDAKYWGRALLMPAHLLEPAAQSIYRSIANELGFSDAFQFSALFTAHLATLFDIPQDEAQRRIDGYIGDLRGRMDRSIAVRHDSLLSVSDSVTLSRLPEPELTARELFGD